MRYVLLYVHFIDEEMVVSQAERICPGSPNWEMAESESWQALCAPKCPLITSCYPGTMESTWSLETDQGFVRVCYLTFDKLLSFSEPQFFN